MIPEKEREALMRLTMCARKECAICKYKGSNKEDCYERATECMHILADALRVVKPDVLDGKIEFFGLKLPMRVVECADHEWGKNTHKLSAFIVDDRGKVKVEFESCKYHMVLFADYEDGTSEPVLTAKSNNQGQEA